MKSSAFLKPLFTSLLFFKQHLSQSSNNNLIFRQLFEASSSTYTYILGDRITKECIIIDPVLETSERDLKLLQELELHPKFGLNTHMHADHITATGTLKKRLGNKLKSVIGANSGAKADIYLQDGDIIKFGKYEILAKSTPGHTNGCLTYIFHQNGMAFTGDTLLIRGCGRTDFQEGSASTLYDSIQRVIFTLPDHFFLYPAHDYKGMLVTTVGEEKRFNPRLTKSKEEFIKIMDTLNLPPPKKINESVKANRVCGLYEIANS